MNLTMFKKKINWLYLFLLIFIFVIGFVLRIVGAGWGMPHRNLHPDEGLVFGQAYECALNRSFEVRDYFRPNHVSTKMNTLLYIGIQELYFEPMGQSDFALNYNENFALFTTASRILTAMLSLGTVIFAYNIGRLWGRRQGLFAALLFAIFPAFIEHSHYITPDIPLLFFLMGVLWAAFCYLRRPSTSSIVLMSLFTALATCEKYPGLYGCVIIAVVICVTHIKKPALIIKKGFLSIIFLVLGIMAVSPILLVDFRNVLEIIAGQNKQYHLGADGLNFFETLFFYLKTAGVHLGLILTLCSIYAIIRMLREYLKETIILLSFLAYILPISTLSVHWERYTLPIYAMGLLFGAIGIFYVLDDLQGLLTRRFGKGKKIIKLCIYSIFLALPVCSLFAGSIAVTGSFLAPDNRIVLQETFSYIDITADNTVYDCNTPLDPGGYYGAFGNFEEGDPQRYKYGSGPKFIMTSSAQRDLYLESNTDIYGWVANFYLKLDELYPLVCLYPVEIPSSHFLELKNIWYSARSVYRYMRGATVGYEIRVYQLLP